jgi:hypothetical protein
MVMRMQVCLGIVFCYVGANNYSPLRDIKLFESITENPRLRP